MRFYSLEPLIAFQAKAAKAPPMNGPTIKIQRSFNAATPPKRAGPKERAGLTDVPVKRMPTRWITIRVKPMARPARLLVAPFVFEVAPSTTNTKMQVRTISTIKALITLALAPLAPMPVCFTVESVEIITRKSTNAPKIPPMNCPII